MRKLVASPPSSLDASTVPPLSLSWPKVSVSPVV